MQRSDFQYVQQLSEEAEVMLERRLLPLQVGQRELGRSVYKDPCTRIKEAGQCARYSLSIAQFLEIAQLTGILSQQPKVPQSRHREQPKIAHTPTCSGCSSTKDVSLLGDINLSEN